MIKVEKGQVWENIQTKGKYVIIGYHNNSQDFIGFCNQTKNLRLFDKGYDMSKHFVCLGKSKANIEDLFEVATMAENATVEESHIVELNTLVEKLQEIDGITIVADSPDANTLIQNNPIEACKCMMADITIISDLATECLDLIAPEQPMTWDELKELYKSIKWKNSVGSIDYNIICMSLPNCSMSYLKFCSDKTIEVIIYDSINNINNHRILTKNKTPQQMWELIKILGS